MADLIKFDEAHGVYRWRKQIRLDDRTPLRLSGTATTKANARKDRDRAVRRALSESREIVPPAQSKTFEAFAEEWLATFPASRGNRATTIESKTYHVRRRLIPYLATVRLNEITSRMIDQMVGDLRTSKRLDGGAKPLSVKTVGAILQTLRRILRSAVTWGDLESLPEFPTLKMPKAKFDFLTFDESSKLLNVAQTNAYGAYVLLLTAIRTGPRAGELLGLTWDRVDFERGTIRYDRQLAKRPPGSDKPPALVEVKEGERTVPMTGALAHELEKLREHRIAGGMAALPCDLVFVGQGTGAPFSRRYLKVILEATLARAGLRRLHPHALRHTFASHCAMKGIPIQQIQQWLGHSSIVMTMRYAHLAPCSTSRDLINLLDSKPSEPSGVPV